MSGQNAYEVYKELDGRLKKVEEGLEKMNEIADAFHNAKGAFATLEWMGKTSKILTPLFLLVGVLSFDVKKLVETVTHFFGK